MVSNIFPLSPIKEKYISLIIIPLLFIVIYCSVTGCSHTTKEHDISGKNNDANMTRILTMLDKDIGIDLSDYISDVYYEAHDTIYYIRMIVKPGKEDDVKQVLTTVCGEPAPARCRKHPVFNNAISDAFNEAELLEVYDYLKSGTNGAKTESITFYTAKGQNNAELYIFGTFPNDSKNTKENIK